MTQDDRYIFQGTELKYLLNIQSEGFNMLEDDFKVVIKVHNTSRFVEIPKGEMILTQEDKFLFTLDTSVLGTGDYYISVIAKVPDSDFDDGLRTEVQKKLLCSVM